MNPEIEKRLADNPEIIYWKEWVKIKKCRPYLKRLHALMLSPSGVVTLEGAKPNGVKSQGYGKGTGVNPSNVLWDSDYAREKLLNELEPLKVHVSSSQFLSELLVCDLGIKLTPAESDKTLQSEKLKQLLKSLGELLDDHTHYYEHPETPRNKNVCKFMTKLLEIIAVIDN